MLVKQVLSALRWGFKWSWLVIGVCLLVQSTVNAKLSGSLTEEDISERLKPSAHVFVEEEDGNQLKKEVVSKASGPKKIYDDNCKMCHQPGLAGAPKLGNKADWSSRVGQGLETMLEKAYNGFKGMPPKGNCLTCSKDDLKETIEYMLSAIK